MVVIYPAIFTATHDSKDTYIIDIPDLNGNTEGYGLKDAYKMARDFIGCKGLGKDDSEMPKASDIADIDGKKSEYTDAQDAFVSLVDIDLDEYRRKVNNRAVRKTVSLPGWLNEAAEKAHINISRVLQDALMEKLEIAK